MEIIFYILTKEIKNNKKKKNIFLKNKSFKRLTRKFIYIDKYIKKIIYNEILKKKWLSWQKRKIK